MAALSCNIPRAPGTDLQALRRLAAVWPKVHIDQVEVVAFRRQAHVRAVIQLAGLTPADVHVQLLPMSSRTEDAEEAEHRLSSTHSLHNGRFAFESPTFPSDNGSAHYWLLRVCPREGSAPEPVAQLLTVGAPTALPGALVEAGSLTPSAPGDVP